MTAAETKQHPLNGQKFLSLEDQRRNKTTRYVTVKFVRDERRIHDRKKRPYAHCISVVTASESFYRSHLIGKPRTCVISVARLSRVNEYKPVDEKGNDLQPAPSTVTRAQVESHQVSDGRGGDLPGCPGGHTGPCHEKVEAPAPRFTAEECPA